MRQIRKNGLDAAKKCKGDFSEDDLKRCSKEVSIQEHPYLSMHALREKLDNIRHTDLSMIFIDELQIENHTEKAVENIHSMAVQKEKEIMQA